MRTTRTRIMGGTAVLVALGAILVGLATAGGPLPQNPPPSAPEKTAEAPLRAALAGFVKVFNAHDAKSLASMFTEDAEVVGSDGIITQGRDAINASFTSSFQDLPNLNVEAELDTVRFVTPDVAKTEGNARLSGGSGDAVQRTRFSALLVHRDGHWIFNELRDAIEADADVTPYERLRELEWMVGDWVNEGEDGKITSNVSWADKQSFLIRTYSIDIPGQKPTTGTMFIGWSPETSQIKSWVFDSEGGHGEGYWTHASSDIWVVKASGTLRDGRPTSATQIHTLLGKDSVKTSSIDRIVGGKVAPDAPEVVMVRKPPQPGVVPTPVKPATPGR
jgi:uncharacterized protein (TIGR02246 family)